MKIWSTPLINIGKPRVARYAKTLYKPVRPNNKKKLITDYTKAKVPHFFIQAKDKKAKNVSEANNSTVNRLGRLIKNPKINFKAANIGQFDYRVLLSSKDAVVKLDDDVINTYIELDQKKHFMMKGTLEDSKTADDVIIYRHIRNVLSNKGYSLNQVVDMLVIHLYQKNNSSFKTTLWSSFGDVIVNNLKRNIDSNTIQCQVCGSRTLLKNGVKYCNECSKIIAREKKRARDRRHKAKKRATVNRNAVTVDT